MHLFESKFYLLLEYQLAVLMAEKTGSCLAPVLDYESQGWLMVYLKASMSEVKKACLSVCA